MGNYVLTGSGPTLLWLDVTDKHNPVVVWEALISGQASEFAIQDSIGYVLSGYNTLQIVDFRGPTEPTIIGQLPVPYASSLAVRGSFIFVKRLTGSLVCIDASDLSSPYIRSAVISFAHWGPLTISGNNLYLGDQGGIVPEYFDVSNPDSIRVNHSLNLPGLIGAALARDTLLLVNEAAKLNIYSIAIPDSPSLLSSTLMPDTSGLTSIVLHGDTAYVGTAHGAILVVDISSRTQPLVVGNYAPAMPTILGAFSLSVEDTTLYCAYGNSLTTFSVSNQPTVLSLFPTGHQSNQVVVRDGLAYVTSGMAGLWVVDVSDPVHPRRRGNIQTSGYARDIVVDSTVAYVTFGFPDCNFNHGEGRTGVWAIDISRPDSLRVLDSYMTRFPFSITKSGSLLFVTNGDIINCGIPDDTTLTILDVSNPYSIRRAGCVFGGYEIGCIASRDSMAFVATSDSGLKIYDCRDPAHPQLLSSRLRNAFGVSLSGQRAYVNGKQSGGLLYPGDSLLVLDITNPAVPFVLGGTSNLFSVLPKLWKSVVAKNVLFWAAPGIFGAIDVSNGSQPSVVFEDSRRRWGGGIQVVKDTLYVTSQSEGVWVFSYKGGTSSVTNKRGTFPGRTRLLPNYPNPFNAATQLQFVTETRQHVRIEVFNVLGQHVSTAFEGMAEAGEHRVEFDGSGLSSGTYFYKLLSGSASSVGRMVLLK
jgi:hypothetical protein